MQEIARGPQSIGVELVHDGVSKVHGRSNEPPEAQTVGPSGYKDEGNGPTEAPRRHPQREHRLPARYREDLGKL